MTPNGWQRYKIGGLLANDTPGYWGAPASGSGDIAVLRSTNLRDNEKLDFGDIAIRSFSDKKIIQKRLEPGDVLLERSGGGPNKPVGRVAYFEANGTYSCSNFMQRLRPNLERVRGKFLAYELSYLHASSVTVRMQQATTGIRNLNYAEYLAYELAVPPLSEQRKIAVILSSVDDAIEKTRAVIDQVQVVKRGLMQELFTQGLPGRHGRPKPLLDWRLGRVASNVTQIPESWDLVPILSVAKLESGHTPSRRKPEYWNGSVPWISLHDTASLDGPEIVNTKQSISELGLRNSSARLLPRGTVVFSRTATVGKSTIMAREMSTTQDFANYVCGPRLHNRYLMQLFRHMQPEWKRLMAGSTHKTVYMPIFRQLQILLPPVAEQEEIANLLERLDDRIVAETQRQAMLRNLKDALVSVLLTGEIRVTPDPEPA